MRLKQVLCFLFAILISGLTFAQADNESASVGSFSPIGIAAFSHGCDSSAEAPAKPEKLIPEIKRLFYDNDCVLSEEISDRLRELYFADRETGRLWAEYLEYWDYLNTEMPEITDVCSDDLADDGSLCIVVLGYVLNSDGSMKQALADRCETARKCAEKYPNAHIIVTGGCSSGSSRFAEGESMARWLTKHGIEKSRILVDNSASATTYNAINAHKLIDEFAPEVKSLVLVTSDFHVRSAAAVFAAEFILSGSDIRIVENVAASTDSGFKYDYSSQHSRANAVIDRFFP